MTTKPYAPEWVAMRDASPNKYRPLPSNPTPPEQGWTWNKAKTKVIFVSEVRHARWFNHARDTLDAGKGRISSFPWSQYWETEQEAIAALVSHHQEYLANLKKQVKSTEAKIAALKVAATPAP